MGCSLLHFAARYGHVELVEFLLTESNDVNARNNLSETPLHVACGTHVPSEERS